MIISKRAMTMKTDNYPMFKVESRKLFFFTVQIIETKKYVFAVLKRD